MALVAMIVGFLVIVACIWFAFMGSPTWRVPEGETPFTYYFRRRAGHPLKRFSPLQLFGITFGIFLLIGGAVAGALGEAGLW